MNQTGLRRLLHVALTLSAAIFSGPPASAHTPSLPHRWPVAVEGHTLIVWERRPPTPKGVILLLHGRTWSALPDFDLQVPGEERSVMRALQARGYAAYALDLRGYGATARDSTGWLTPDRAAADVAAVLQWLTERNPSLPRPVLLGWSNGARVAQLAAQRSPSLISTLVLYGYPHDPAVVISATPTPPTPPRDRNTAADAASDFISPRVMSQRVIDIYVRAALQADPVRVDWRALEQWNALKPEEVHVPTLLLHGARDPLAKVDAQARLFTRLGTADREWRVLAGGDHAALIEDTQPAFVAVVCEFIERPRLRPAPEFGASHIQEGVGKAEMLVSP